MSYQEKYLKYKSKYLNLRAEIHNNNLENRLEQNGGNIDILNVDQLSGTASITEKKYLMLGGSNESDFDLPDKLTETPISESENNLTSEEISSEKTQNYKLEEISKKSDVKNNLSSEEKPKKSDVKNVNSNSEQDNSEQDNSDQDNKEQDNSEQDNSEQDNSEQDNSEQDNKEQDDDFESSTSASLSSSSSESKNQKGGKKEEKNNKKTAWFSDSELVSTDTTFMSFSTLDTSSESDL